MMQREPAGSAGAAQYGSPIEQLGDEGIQDIRSNNDAGVFYAIPLKRQTLRTPCCLI